MHARTVPLYCLFFAVKPPPVLARSIDYFAELRAGKQRRIMRDHQHVTLGITIDWLDYPDEQIKALLRGATAIMAEPFDLLFDQLSCGDRSVALRPSHTIDALKELQRQVALAMRQAGMTPRPDWNFSPHQTLFYHHDGAAPSQRINGFGWHVEEFVLICSHVGRTRHDILGRWSLRGSAQYSLF